MGARKFDRNADQLCQIMAHLTQLNLTHNMAASAQRMVMIEHIKEALACNDALGKMTEKGLI